nr:hypothetical protein [Deltaproteobacteria bacterium]
MAGLEKAKLSILEGKSSTAKPKAGTEVPVQFNPATLKLTLTNKHEGGQTFSRQVRQYTGSSSASYSLELEFDSADEANSDQTPLSVRDKTWIVERYLEPTKGGGAPPRLRFSWGDLIIDGVVESLDLEFDHFASNGVPLRAKATLSLKEQKNAYKVIPAKASKQKPPTPGGSSNGTPGGGNKDAGEGKHSDVALEGETPPEFAARQGLDPEAWRGLGFGAGVGAGIGLAAGAEIGFSAGATVSAGLGVHVGFSAGVSASLDASFGL